MTGMSMAAVALAVAVLVRPGGAVVAARLASLRPAGQRLGQPGSRDGPLDGRSPLGQVASIRPGGAVAARLAGLRQTDHQPRQPDSRRDWPPDRNGWPLDRRGGSPDRRGWPLDRHGRSPLGQADQTAPSRPVWRRLPPMPVLAAAGTGLLPVALGGGVGGLVLGVGMGGAAFAGARWLLRKGGRPVPDPLRLASCWDLLAACLRGGLPVPVAVRAVVAEVPAPADAALDRTAELLALGADPVSAWAPALAEPLTAELARGARRSARSGAALAAVAEGLAGSVRAGADDLAEAKAQRAAVAVTGPLGLCFLPAFLCIGVVPVVIGLATRLMASW